LELLLRFGNAVFSSIVNCSTCSPVVNAMNLLETAKTELFRSNADRKHPFRLMYLATRGAYPEVRTVVKRHIDQELRVLFYTDQRSPKVQQIQHDPRVSLLFYHPRKQLQVRIRGEASLLTAGSEYEARLQQIKQSPGLKDYTTGAAPGSLLQEGTAFGENDEIHFAMVKIHPHLIDVLQLAPKGHQRAEYQWQNDQWAERRLVP
jgi:pyridoxamine 5'-phosphate oxidase